jgi:glycerol uptake facilitator protein
MGDTVAVVEATLPQKCMAEAVGTFLNVLGGCSVGAADKYLHCGLGLLGQSIAWGVSVALSIFCAREVSGGHCNPAATVAMWFHNGFPLRHVPFYIASQLCGAVLAGTMVYGMFSGGIAALEVELKLPRGTSPTTYAGAFGLVPGPTWLSGAGAFGVECVATTFLIFIVFTVTDWEGPVPKNAQPLLIGTAAALMIAAFGALDGSGMNPARDTGPRIVCYFAGWGYIAFAFWWAYLLGPLCGGLFGGWIYNRFFKTLSKQAPSTPEI